MVVSWKEAAAIQAFGLQGGARDAQQHGAGRGRPAAAGHDFLVALLELGLAGHVRGQEIGVARILDLHFPHHLPDEDFDVLVVNAHRLAAVHRLDFVEDVLLQFFLAADAQDVVRDQRAVHQAVAGAHLVALADEDVLALRHEMLHLQAGIGLDL